VRIVAKLPSACSLASSGGGGGGVGAFATTRGVRGADGVRTVFALGFGLEELPRAPLLAAVFRAAALRQDEVSGSPQLITAIDSISCGEVRFRRRSSPEFRCR